MALDKLPGFLRACFSSILVWVIVAASLFGNARAQSVKFLGEDRVTQGTWRGAYGMEGAHVFYDQKFDPVYGVTSVAGYSDASWSFSSSDTRAPQRINADELGRVMACLYSPSTMTFSITCPSDEFRRFSIYCADYDSNGRSQTFEVRDAVTDALLDSRQLSNFQNGVYLRWNIKGSVKINVINTSPVNAVASAYFFDPASQNPAWWLVGQPAGSGNPPVIDSGTAQNDLGAVNVGQAKWMAKSALEALRSVRSDLGDAVQADLAAVIPNWAAPTTPAEVEALKAPLTIGQLKAISAPFYKSLYAFNEDWLHSEMVRNGTAAPGGHFPWLAASGPGNLSPATIGQLKAVFALRFGSGMDGLLAHWKMNEPSGNILNDSGSSGQNAVLTGAPLHTSGSNGLGAIQFDGIDDSAITPVGSSYPLNLNNHSFSLSVWFKTTTVSTARLISKGNGHWLSVGHINPGNITFGVDVRDIASDGIVGTTNTFNDGRWHHAVGVCNQTEDGDDDRKRLRIYVDGELQPIIKYPNSGGTLVEGNTALDFQSIVPVTATRNDGVSLGSVGGVAEFLNGELDDARIYGRALDAAGVLSLYNLDEDNNGVPDRKDKDHDAVADDEDADPSDSNVGRLAVSIISPVNGATVR